MSIFKTYKLLLPLIVCTLITLSMAIYLLSAGNDRPDETETENNTEYETESETPKMENPIFTKDLAAYEAYMDVPSGSFLLLVNKQNTLTSDYVPADCISVKDTSRDITLARTAEMALEAMFIEMRAAGYANVFVTSAYRTYDYQHWLFFDVYLPDEMAKNPTLSREQAIEKVLRYSAYPGTSEHQTGLCVDLMVNGMRELDESFADYPVYDWLLENAWKFGFILRFPEDKTDITGYDFEPWHYRFVGRYDAYMIHTQGLCLEEYIEQIN